MQPAEVFLRGNFHGVIVLDGALQLALAGGALLGHDDVAVHIRHDLLFAVGLHDHRLRVEQVGVADGHVLCALGGDAHAVPDAVDVLGVQLDLLGVPADDDEVGLDAEVRAHRLGKFGVKADQLARLGVLVVDGGEEGDADVEDAVAEDVIRVAPFFREGEGQHAI